MQRNPFPAIHRTANEKAAANVQDGRELRDRADTLLGDIDELLGTTASQEYATSPVTRAA